MPPVCSVVIATYKQGELLRDCLASLHEVLGPPGDFYEVILVINGAQFEWSNSLVEVLRGVQVIDSPINLGFSGGYNLGASKATGEYIVLLNDDTVILPNWLEPMIADVERLDNVGAVGSCNLSFDDTIEEAGSVIFSNGTTMGCGRDMPANSLEWDFVRDVDYLSASSMLLPRAAWEAVGGLNIRFHPAYHEDVDLCLRLKELGYRIIYEPRSKVRHHVSQSSDQFWKDMLMQHNRDYMVERWVNEYRENFPAPVSWAEMDLHVERAAERARRVDKQVLLIDDLLPSTGIGAGFGRSVLMIEELVAANYAVTIAPTYIANPRTSDQLRELGVRVIADLETYLARPEIVFDVVVVSRQTNAKHIETVRRLQPQAAVVMDHESLYHVRIEREAAMASDPDEIERLTNAAAVAKTQENVSMTTADLNVCISAAEAEYVQSVPGSSPALVIEPRVAQIEPTPATLDGRRDMVFVAGWMAGPASPNVDALRWFVNEVLPRVRAEVPWARVGVTGASPPFNVREMVDDGVGILGFVEDLRPLYASACAVIAPIRFGAGVKLKTVEGLEYGVPTVATTIGAEGIDLGAHSSALVVTDDPAAYAGALVALLTDNDAWRARARRHRRVAHGLGAAARRIVESRRRHRGRTAGQPPGVAGPAAILAGITSPSAAPLDAPTLASLAVAAGSRVLVVAAQADSAEARLADRNCQVFRVSSLDEAQSRSVDGPFDAVVVLDGFENIADPIEALRALAKLVGASGLAIVVADNVGHAAVRIKAVLGQTDVSGALPIRRYDLAGLELVVAEAGLNIVERLRVIEPVAPDQLDAVAPGLSALITGDDVATRQFVIVATPGPLAASAETVAEAMQRTVAELSARVAQFDSLRAELSAAQQTISDQTIELDARKAALEERIELVERLYAERRHLELEIVVKDDYISILRRDRNDWRNLHGAVQYELDDLRRSRHYKVAAGMHRALQRVPLLPRVARFAARRLMATRGRGA